MNEFPYIPTPEEAEGLHRHLPDGNVITLYRQVYNSKITRSGPESWPDFWDESW